MTTPAVLPQNVLYVGLLFSLLVLPKILQRYGLPSAVTCFLLGVGAGAGLGILRTDPVIELLSTLGISALFLFAGLEVSVDDLERDGRLLAEHVVLRVIAVALTTWFIASVLHLEARPAALVALALLTPSTGFILDSLPSWRLPDALARRIRAMAIGTEVVALGLLFVVLKAGSFASLAASGALLGVLVVALPPLFRGFARFVLPHAPRSEFSFLLMTAVAFALVTKQIGVYYLVGAFLVGIAAQRFRARLPSLGSERMLHGVEAFASVSVPFYFFHAGTRLQRDDLSAESLGLGICFLAVGVPLRLGSVIAHHQWRQAARGWEALRLAAPLLPTLVFTLVLAGLLREQFGVNSPVFGGLVFYALGTTLVPPLLLKTPAPDFDTPEAPPLNGTPEPTETTPIRP